MTRLGGRLDDRAAALATVRAATGAAPVTGADARAQVARLAEALAAVLDGDALPVLPPVARVPATTPLLEDGVEPAGALGDWASVRERVGRAVRLADPMGGLVAFPISAAATDDEADDPTADQRDEAVAPRTRLFGAVLGAPDTRDGADRYVGIVIDEWADVRPSRVQQTGVAVHYDTPQSEPPHCLLLSVPPIDPGPAWTPSLAAAMVGHAIRWMTIRALPSAQRRLPAAMLPHGNQVPSISVRRPDRRIPVRRFARDLDLLSALRDGELVVLADGGPFGIEGIGLSEITGFGGKD